ncbi:phospholipase A1-like isoform X2 [Eurosta solidaginis]
MDGSLKWVTEAEAEKMEQKISGRASAVTIFFHLYTVQNPNIPNIVISGSPDTLRSSHFNSNKPTVFIIHGWQSDSSSDMMYDIRDAYLSRGNFNIFTVDWSDKSLSYNYASAKNAVPGVGKQVASFIDFLHKQGGASLETLHLVGHSLGAHVAGYAGKNVMTGKINQITGLDPAFPLFSYNNPSTRLNENDASYVESIHTCGGLLGFKHPIGQSAFYPNGGKGQPGCGLDLAGTCAHSRSWMYFAEGIRKNSFTSVKCDSWKSAVGKSCGKTYSAIHMCASSNIVSANGYYYVPVNKVAPYGMAS